MVKCDMPRTIKTNCKIKTKVEHGGIRKRYAKFELVVRRLINYTKHLSALAGRLCFGVNVLGATWPKLLNTF